MAIAKSEQLLNFALVKDRTVWPTYFGASFSPSVALSPPSASLPSQCCGGRERGARLSPVPRAAPEQSRSQGLCFPAFPCQMQALQPQLSDILVFFLLCSQTCLSKAVQKADCRASCETRCCWALMGQITRGFGSRLVCFMLCEQNIILHILQVLPCHRAAMAGLGWQHWDISAVPYSLLSICLCCCNPMERCGLRGTSSY